MNLNLALPMQKSSWAFKALTVLAGTGVLTLSSYIQVPFFPVPMTMQTLAVALVGAVIMARRRLAMEDHGELRTDLFKRPPKVGDQLKLI